jgi:hypothetical protein
MLTNWWHIEVLRHGQKVYIGKCSATLEEIRVQFAKDLPNRRLAVQGDLITVF